MYQVLFIITITVIVIILLLLLLDCDIFYQLYYKIDLIPDTGNINQARICSPLIPILIGKNDASANSITFNDNTSGDHCLFCTHPSGIVNARSQLRNTFTFHPPLAGLFEMFLYAKVRVNNSGNSASMMPNEEVALLRISQHNREASYINSDDTGGDLMVSLSDVPLTATITSRSAYPTIIFDDIRVDGNMLPISYFILLTNTTTRL